MPFQLQTLLDLRRHAEKDARQAFDVAMAARRQAEDQQEHLLAHWQEACATVAKEEARLATSPNPLTAEQAATRANYLRRLRDEAAQRKTIAEEHRTAVLVQAVATESVAQAAYEEARKACEAVQKLKERADAEDERKAERRADESAADLAQAAHFRRRSK
jgi:flagellar biosynthesis chaperone FliJ